MTREEAFEFKRCDVHAVWFSTGAVHPGCEGAGVNNPEVWVAIASVGTFGDHCYGDRGDDTTRPSAIGEPTFRVPDVGDDVKAPS